MFATLLEMHYYNDYCHYYYYNTNKENNGNNEIIVITIKINNNINDINK